MGKDLEYNKINKVFLFVGCLALKYVESKTTFKNGENRRFRFVGVAGTRTKAQKRQKAQVFGWNTHDVKPNPSSMPKKSQKPVETEAEELARLREENKRLAEALKMAEWMNHAKDVMIDEAEKMFNIPIRKKAGAKQ